MTFARRFRFIRLPWSVSNAIASSRCIQCNIVHKIANNWPSGGHLVRVLRSFQVISPLKMMSKKRKLAILKERRKSGHGKLHLISDKGAVSTYLPREPLSCEIRGSRLYHLVALSKIVFHQISVRENFAWWPREQRRCVSSLMKVDKTLRSRLPLAKVKSLIP